MIHPRLLTVPTLFLLSIYANCASAQSDLTADPFVVQVESDGGYARCGPSEDSYETDPLRRGQSLDVYVQTPDGWLGVRPPENSFCWVPADAVEMQNSKQSGTIIEDGTAVWIGTHLEKKPKHQWQVKLATGEPITVISRSKRQGPDGPQLWFRIVPPSGEYRWVHRSQVVMNEQGADKKDQETLAQDSSTEARTVQPRARSKTTDRQSETLADALRKDGLIALFGRGRRQQLAATETVQSLLAQPRTPLTDPNSAVMRQPLPAPYRSCQPHPRI